MFNPNEGDEEVRAPRALPDTRPLEEQLAEERWYSWQLAALVQELASMVQGTSFEGGIASRALALAREHPVIEAQNRAVADFMNGHPDLRGALCTTGIMEVAEARLRAAGYAFPEGMHITDV